MSEMELEYSAVAGMPAFPQVAALTRSILVLQRIRSQVSEEWFPTMVTFLCRAVPHCGRNELRHLKFALNGCIVGSHKEGNLSGRLDMPNVQWLEVRRLKPLCFPHFFMAPPGRVCCARNIPGGPCTLLGD